MEMRVTTHLVPADLAKALPDIARYHKFASNCK